MTKEQVEKEFKEAIKNATSHFVGEKLDKNTADKVKATVKEAVNKFYDSLPPIVIDQYNIKRPNPVIVINGNEIKVYDGGENE